jgi:copper chaperone
MAKVTYSIPNISCDHCVHTIKTELEQLEGVIHVDASQVTKEVNIEFQPPANEQQIRELLAEINYPPAA